MSRWCKEGDLYNEAVRRTQVCLKQGSQLVGILWHQGENDAGFGADASSYQTKLCRALTSLREDLNAGTVPIVLGELGRFIDTDDPRFEHVDSVNLALHRAARQLPKCSIAMSDGLTCMPDNLHFDTAGAERLGERYAEKFLELYEPIVEEVEFV